MPDNDNITPNHQRSGRAHIPRSSPWMNALRFYEFALAISTIAAAGYSAKVFGADAFPGYIMTFFTFGWTIIYIFYIQFATFRFPKIYLYWVQLGLECATCVFWLISFSLLAQASVTLNNASNDTSLPSGIIYSTPLGDLINLDSWPRGRHAITTTKVATGFSALEFVFFMLSVGGFGYFLHKHRMEKGAVFPGDLETGNRPVTPGSQQPVELTNFNQQAYEPQQDGYVAPPPVYMTHEQTHTDPTS